MMNNTELLLSKTVNDSFHTDYLKLIRQDIYNVGGYVSNSILETKLKKMF